MPRSAEDPVLSSARREAIVVVLMWAVAMCYTVGYCATHAYGRKLETLRFVLGFPDWIFWGILAPWAACLAASWVFAIWFMRDDDLGDEATSAGAGSDSQESDGA
jgi:hypothetical protein